MVEGSCLRFASSEVALENVGLKEVQVNVKSSKSTTIGLITLVLPTLSNSWILNIIWLYIALNRTPNVDCYWVGAVPNL